MASPPGSRRSVHGAVVTRRDVGATTLYYTVYTRWRVPVALGEIQSPRRNPSGNKEAAFPKCPHVTRYPPRAGKGRGRPRSHGTREKWVSIKRNAAMEDVHRKAPRGRKETGVKRSPRLRRERADHAENRFKLQKRSTIKKIIPGVFPFKFTFHPHALSFATRKPRWVRRS